MIADALARQRGWPSELRHLEMRPDFVKGKPRVGPTLYHLDPARSDALTPPWPDLILTSGHRPGNAALWIKRQSGGRSRIVLVGKPSGWMSHLDLVVASAETLLAPFDNVLQIDLPLMRVEPDRLAAGRAAWRETFDTVPRPLVAVLIGGPTVPFVFDAAVARRLRARTRRVLEAGGTPCLVGSRRTPPGFLQQVVAGLPETPRVFDWAQSGAGDPYAGLLAHADRFVVTGDSISMQVEVARLGRPLEILPLSIGWLGGLDDLRRRLTARMFQPPRDARLTTRLRVAVARGLFRAGLLPQTRHFPRFHQMLVDRGLARWADDADAAGVRAPAPVDSKADMARILARIDRLLDGPAA
ncbi:MAG: ELM1/GtrOC1 family putative glycosyltransferase [Roseovarius sp.]